MNKTAIRWLTCIGLIYASFTFFAQPADNGEGTSAEPTWHGKTSIAIDKEALSAVDEMMSEYVEEGRVAGVVVSVAYRNDVVYTKAVGNRGTEDERPVKEDDLFRIYSMTKPITGVALMQLHEQGKFELDDRLDKYIPELANLKVHNDEGDATTPERPITIRNLLTHTAGFGYVFTGHSVDQLTREAMQAKDLEEFVQKVAEIPLRYEPGTRWHYSIAVDLQGLLIERLSGKTFDVYLEESIFDPLGMEDTFFGVPEEKFERFLPNHNWSRSMNHLIQSGQGAFDSYRNPTFFSGGGGLVSTAHDYMTFARAVANGGELNGVRILKSETVEEMRRNHLDEAIDAEARTGQDPGAMLGPAARSFGFGLGFGVNTGESTAQRSKGEYNWGGAAGTVFWIDPVEDLIVVGMIQRMGGGVPLSRDLHRTVRSALVYE
ncbi:MAG: serine hydrolase [Gammaproteobacteria bacterium]|nr:serine hydrolase [Gammaproteobacteria bacterium]